MKWIIAAGLMLGSTAAQAEVISSGANGFHVRHSLQLVVPQDRAFAVFGRIGEWWEDAHSYSGSASNMSLSLSPGGCFCERLPGGGGVEHMRVAFVEPAKRLVLIGSLGPLLYEATTGVMDVQFERIAGGTRVRLDYKVSGFADGGGQSLAPAVDRVLGAQLAGYRKVARAEPLTR